ncbi:MAG TPA: hypothetical protein VK324_14430, partial [Tepidisphaeraceae bacterium]|nr:hypothetical protein [Tepidisphaeraceae bacterium]
MPALTNHTGLIVAGVIVLLGLVVYGFRDLIRFSFTRVWAISGVCFDESIRRRVLWITPLAIVGIILVSQLTRPIDEQDAIRQTTKFCLFATGLVVTLTAIILACTNLPKEIESRVIFTIVTKPTTRLEIVLGKVLGFARVSAAILLIMGAFSYAYLALRAWSLGQDVRDRLPTADAVSKPTLEHYASAGLLNAREFLEPRDVQFYAEVPGRADDVRWFSAAAEQTAYVPYVLDPATFPLPRTEEEAAALGLPPLAIMVVADFRRPQGETAAESADAATTTAPTAASRVQVPFLPGMEPNAPAGEEPSLVFDVVDKDFYSLANFQQLINGGRPVKLTATNEPVIVPVGPALLPQLAKLAPPGEPVRFYLKITGGRSGYHYGLGDDAVYLGVRPAPDQFVPIPPAPDAMAGGRRAETLFRGRPGRAAPQL